MMKDFATASLQSPTEVEQVIRKFQNSYRALKRYEVANHGYVPVRGIVFDIFSELRFLNAQLLYREESLRLAAMFDESTGNIGEKAHNSLCISKFVFSFVALALLHNTACSANKLCSDFLGKGIVTVVALGLQQGNIEQASSAIAFDERNEKCVPQEFLVLSLLRDAAALSRIVEGKRTILGTEMTTQAAKTLVESMPRQRYAQLRQALEL